MMKRWDVLGFGCISVDDLVYVDAIPGPDTKTVIREKKRAGGGLTGTALVAASRLGARAAFCGVLGDDELSRFTINELEREGVDCSEAPRRPDARVIHSIVIVARETGERTILYSEAGVQHRQPDEITAELIGACRVFFVDHDGIPAGLRAVQVAHELGIPVVGDFESTRHTGVEELMAGVDHLIISEELALKLTGESDAAAAIGLLRSADRACMAATAGDRGCWYAQRGGEVIHFPAFRVSVVDTTGCGDVFHGAYAASLAKGESVDTAIQIASAAAAIKATRPGGRSGIPDRRTIESFLKERSHEDQ